MKVTSGTQNLGTIVIGAGLACLLNHVVDALLLQRFLPVLSACPPHTRMGGRASDTFRQVLYSSNSATHSADCSVLPRRYSAGPFLLDRFKAQEEKTSTFGVPVDEARVVAFFALRAFLRVASCWINKDRGDGEKRWGNLQVLEMPTYLWIAFCQSSMVKSDNGSDPRNLSAYSG